MKTYNFKVVIEPDEDFEGNPAGWHAYCPALEHVGGSTWGETEAEALKKIDDVVHLVIESMVAHGEPIPQPADHVARNAVNAVRATVHCTMLRHGGAP